MSQPKLSDWMSDLPGNITCQPLNHLAIPGSHNSFTYSITRDSPVSPDGPIYDVVSKLPTPIAGGLMCPWTVTQNVSIRDQLEAGIRYLDFRVGVRPLSNSSPADDDYEFYLVHGQFALTISEELHNVAEFLDAHPREVVLIDCNHCYEFKTAEQVSNFENVVLKMLDVYLMPYQNSVPSLDEMWRTKCQVLFFCNLPRISPLQSNKLWPTSRVKSLWPEKCKTKEMLEFLDKHYGPQFSRATNLFYVHQGILTPDKDYMLRHLTGSVRHLARKAGNAFLDWLRTDERQAGPKGVNITLLDFAVSDFPNYVTEVIQLNRKTWPSSSSSSSSGEAKP